MQGVRGAALYEANKACRHCGGKLRRISDRGCSSTVCAQRRYSNLGDSARREAQWKRLGVAFSQEDWEAMFRLQQGRCALFGISSCSRDRGRLRMDHDHETKRVRGLLCYRHNAAVAGLGDGNHEALQVVLRYLGHG